MKSLFILLIIIMFAATFVYAANEPEDSLILYMSFDTIDGENTIDHSKHGNNGVIAGDPQHVKGKFGKALQLNGQTDWVEIPHHETLTVDKDFTVMAWINAERHMGPNAQRWQGIVAKSNAPRSYSFYTESPSECLHLSVNGGGSVCQTKIPLNEWQHVVGQMENGTHRYFLNGENIGEFGGHPDPPGAADTAPVFIGKTAEGNRQFLAGLTQI